MELSNKGDNKKTSPPRKSRGGLAPYPNVGGSILNKTKKNETWHSALSEYIIA